MPGCLKLSTLLSVQPLSECNNLWYHFPGGPVFLTEP